MIRLTRAAAAAATALALLGAPAQALDLSAMTPAERDAFGEQVRAYLLANPEVILEAVNLLEQQQAADEAARDQALVAANLAELENDGYSFVGGNPEGDITLVEFMDYRCGYCRKAAPEVAELLAEDGNIRWVIKEFPILGDASVLSSRFAVATKQIAGDDAYEDVHKALMGLKGEPNEVALRRLADGLGLDAEAILARMDSDEVTAELRRTRDLAQQLSISGTPTFVLGGELLRGYLPKDQMEIIAAEVRKNRS
ncbi:DsbA family protein [Phaeobacter sp. PT47_59]|uniref:DsbA family protein n=1 Tax=Phaeobacter sp. PT47_59 TaxID=3029979 RepID=UPI00237FE29C|nr:DsbA family protein [Phaeobacter sp. PT47_59]MDE4175832.1 DsbA family protein [Phaeobacter sp. PT47_59]